MNYVKVIHYPKPQVAVINYEPFTKYFPSKKQRLVA